MRILVIAAHPDDEVLGCGATIAKHNDNGHEVYLVVVADGALARYGKEMVSKLKCFCEESAKVLGIKEVFFLGFEDQKLDACPLINLVQSIESIIQNLKPDIVYTHFHSDLNMDHQIVFQATLTACRPTQRFIKKIYCYEVNSSTEWNPVASFCPNVFVDIDKFIEKKIRAFESYLTEIKEFPHPRSKEAVRTLAKYRGFQSGLNAAEAFMLIRGYE